MNVISFVFFIISFMLFILVIVPNIGKSICESKLLCQPQSLRVSGTIFLETKCSSENVSITPITGAIVEVGGFNTMSNTDGIFELDFFSANKSDIPIIFRYGEQEINDRINFLNGESETQKNFTFR